MNDQDLTPNEAPAEPQAAPQPVAPVPSAAPQEAAQPGPVTPAAQPTAFPSGALRVQDVTRVSTPPVAPPESQPAPMPEPAPAPELPPQPEVSVAPVAEAPQPIAPQSPAPTAQASAAAPTATPAQPVLDPNAATSAAQEYQDRAEDSATIADTLKGVFWGFINWIVAPLLIVFVLHNFVFQAYHVDGSSMTPTLHTADYMIVSKVDNTITKLTGKSYIPKRHQVVVFRYPKDPSLVFIKRVIALPGERVVVKDGKITVYNTEHPEGFTPDDDSFTRAAAYSEGDVDEVVPEGSIFVVGDNRNPGGSFDSREWGVLPSEDIIGNAVVRLLPLDGFRLF